jgi:hypothetical protein
MSVNSNTREESNYWEKDVPTMLTTCPKTWQVKAIPVGQKKWKK